MTLVPVNAELAASIAQRAVQYAREDVAGRGWRSSGALMPYSSGGHIGVTSSVQYLIYQDEGTRPYLMYWAEGRTLPLGCKQGDGPHVRRAKEVGKPGYVDIPHKGKTWRAQKWRHPGLKPKRFIEKAVARAIHDSRHEIRADVMKTLKGEA